MNNNYYYQFSVENEEKYPVDLAVLERGKRYFMILWFSFFLIYLYK